MFILKFAGEGAEKASFQLKKKPGGLFERPDDLSFYGAYTHYEPASIEDVPISRCASSRKRFGPPLG